MILAHPGKEEELLHVLHDFYAMLRVKKYSRDLLYRDAKQPRRYINLRYWASEDMRDQAHEDPDVHKYWRRLGDICEIEWVYEKLEPLI